MKKKMNLFFWSATQAKMDLKMFLSIATLRQNVSLFAISPFRARNFKWILSLGIFVLYVAEKQVIIQFNTIYDLLELLIQRDKYYVLNGVNTNRKLGEFHIFAARRSNPDSWIAKSDYADAKQVGRQIKQIEKGEFYRNDYVGRYCKSERDE